MLCPSMVGLVLQVGKCVIDVLIFSMKHVVWATVEPAEHQKRTHYRVSFTFSTFLNKYCISVSKSFCPPAMKETNIYTYVQSV